MKTSNKFSHNDVKAKNTLLEKADTEKISDSNKQLMKKILSLAAVVSVIIVSVITAYANTKASYTVYQVESPESAPHWQNTNKGFLKGKSSDGYVYGSFNLSESLKSDIKDAVSINVIITFYSPTVSTANIGLYLGTTNGTKKEEYEDIHEQAIMKKSSSFTFSNVTLSEKVNEIDVIWLFPKVSGFNLFPILT
jgi:hypothetical protein